MLFKILKIAILTMFMSINTSYAAPQMCIAAYDFGLGGAFDIKANPDEGNSSASRLVQVKPYRDQIAPWVETYLSTTGLSEGSTAGYENGKLKIYIEGKWAPWGGDVGSLNKQCDLRPCDKSKTADAVCLNGGIIVDMKPDGSNVPCTLEDGIGLYGLVALDINGKRYNPNDPAYAKSLPNKYFRTFKMWPLKEDADGKYFELQFTQQCDSNEGGGTVCIGDKDSDGQSVVAKGSLYFKILDRYYQDNTGGYEINVVSGVVSEKGFIESVIESFTQIMMNVAQKMYIALTSDLGFITAVKALLIFYMTMTALLFMLGMINMNQTELIVRVFKIAIITILISDTSWDFFNKYLFSLFVQGAASIGAVVTKATFAYSNDYGFMNFILTDTTSPLSIFDSVLNVIRNKAIHFKILALLFFKYYCVYIIFIYLCIFILIMAIIRAVALYITAVMLIALLLVIAPVFITFILFKFTKELFDGWLKQLMANAMMVVVVSTTIALMANLILNQLYQLLHFKSCWDIVQSVKIAGIHLFDIWFWKAQDPEQLNNALTPEHLFSFLLVCILFNTFMDEIPELIDSLSSAALRPISKAYHAIYSDPQNPNAGIVGLIQSTSVYQASSDFLTAIKSPLSLTEANKNYLRPMHGGIAAWENRIIRNIGEGPSDTTSTDTTQFARDISGSILEKPLSVVPDIFKPKKDDH